MSNYKFTEEYRDRNAFNKGEIYWIEEAINLYKDKVKTEIEESEAKGEQSIVSSKFFDYIFDDIKWKLEAWTDKK